MSLVVKSPGVWWNHIWILHILKQSTCLKLSDKTVGQYNGFHRLSMRFTLNIYTSGLQIEQFW